MSKLTIRFWVGGVFTLMLALPQIGGASANEELLSCVHRDRDLITLIEASGNAQAVPGQVLADAMLAMPDARKACFDGRVEESLARYDRIAVNILQNTIPGPTPDGTQRVGMAGEPNAR